MLTRNLMHWILTQDRAIVVLTVIAAAVSIAALMHAVIQSLSH